MVKYIFTYLYFLPDEVSSKSGQSPDIYLGPSSTLEISAYAKCFCSPTKKSQMWAKNLSQEHKQITF